MEEVIYPWGDSRRYNSYAGYFRRLFGRRMQKLSVDAGFTCPNRDGTLGTRGCTFCNNAAFTPSYCSTGRSIREQIDEGVAFHARRYREAQRYLVYFQSFSNTYAPLEVLRARYEEALSHPLVEGLVIGTRPDCVDEAKLDYLATLAEKHYVAVEYGIESVWDRTLRRIGRGHDYATAVRAVEETAARGLHVGAHFILGLPGERAEEQLAAVEQINRLPLTGIKFHQLQLFRDTPMAEEYDLHPERFSFPSVEEYLDHVVEMLRRLRPDLVFERFASEAPPRFHHGPNWGLVRNERLWAMLEERLNARNAYQGDLYRP